MTILRSVFHSKKVYWIVCATLVLLIVFTHTINLSAVPRGLSIDEAGMAYDAWSIANTGSDGFLNQLPVYFLNRGDGMSALYVYIQALIMAIAGVSVVGIRLPAVLFSLVTLAAGAYIVWTAWPKRRLPLILYLVLFATIPYFTIYSRIALDANLFLPMSTLLLAVIINNLKREGPRWWLVGLVAGLTLYSYVFSWIIVPLFIIVLSIYLLRLRKLPLHHALELWLPFAFLALPLFAVVLVNVLSVDQFMIGPFTVPRLYNIRTHELRPSLQNIREIFNSVFLFDPTFRYVSSNIALMSYPSIPLFVAGVLLAVRRVFRTIRQKNMDVLTLVFLWFLVYFVFSLFIYGDDGTGPVTHQLNGMYFAVLFFVLLALVAAFDYLKRLLQDKPVLRAAPFAFVGAVSLAYAVLFGFFAYDFYYVFPQSWDKGESDLHATEVFGSITADLDSLTEAIAYIDSLPPEVANRYTFIRHVRMPEIYFLLSQGIPVREVIDQRTKKDLRVLYYRNYMFDVPEEYTLEDNYIVAYWQGEEFDELMSMGFSNVKQFGKYWVFTNQ